MESKGHDPNTIQPPGHPTMSALVELVEDLPPLPSSFNKLCRVLDRDDATADDVARVIREDQTMATRLLKEANASHRFRAGTTTTVTRAVVSMGFRAVRATLLGASVTASLGRYFNRENLDLWRHIFAVAVISRSMCNHLGIGEPDEGYVMGLTHDMGHLVLKNHYPTQHAQLITQMNMPSCDLTALELSHYGVTHPDLACLIARRWKLPEMLVQVARFHGEPAGAGEFEDLATLVHVADMLASALGLGHTGDPFVRPLAATRDAMAEIGIHDATTLEPICAEAVTAFRGGFGAFLRLCTDGKDLVGADAVNNPGFGDQ